MIMLSHVPDEDDECVLSPEACNSSSGVGGRSRLLRTTVISAGSELALSRSRGTGVASALGASGGNRPNVAPFGVTHLQTT